MLTLRIDFSSADEDGSIPLEDYSQFAKVAHKNNVLLFDGQVYVRALVHRSDGEFYAEPDWTTRKTVDERIDAWCEAIPELATRPRLCDAFLSNEKFRSKFFRMIDDLIQLGPRLHGHRSAGEIITHVLDTKHAELKEFEGRAPTSHSTRSVEQLEYGVYNEAYGTLSNVAFNALNRAVGRIRSAKPGHPCHVIREMPKPEVLERYSTRRVHSEIYHRNLGIVETSGVLDDTDE